MKNYFSYLKDIELIEENKIIDYIKDNISIITNGLIDTGQGWKDLINSELKYDGVKSESLKFLNYLYYYQIKQIDIDKFYCLDEENFHFEKLNSKNKNNLKYKQFEGHKLKEKLDKELKKAKIESKIFKNHMNINLKEAEFYLLNEYTYDLTKITLEEIIEQNFISNEVMEQIINFFNQ